jgi:hypothetical protein
MHGGRRRPGTPPKGDRAAITVRVPTAHHTVYERTARAQGYDSLSDYLGALLAELHGLQPPDYIHRRRGDPDPMLLEAM